MEPPFVSAAYKWVAIVAMVAEINYCSGKLHMPITPVQKSDVKALILPPSVLGFAGKIGVGVYWFVFQKSGRLHFIDGPSLNAKAWRELANQKSLIGTNEAY